MQDVRSLKEKILSAAPDTWPRCHDAAASGRLQEAIAPLAFEEKLETLITDTASASPFLERMMAKNTTQLCGLLERSEETTLDQLLRETAALEGSIEDIKAGLRNIKDRLMILLALGDLSGCVTDLATMEALSRFADAAVIKAFGAALTDAAGATQSLQVSDFGFAILAMGKHGAYELNYSSDIDLVVFYEREILQTALDALPHLSRALDARKVAIRTTQLAVAILQDPTAEGYVFRTDLRLRPDPGSSAAAVTIAAAERYYEAYGQNWERAAFSKARIITDETAVARQVTDFLTPFIWRKYLDFAAIEDIHSIKRQIHAVKGLEKFEFAGHDIKLGRGGIREIEFFVQTQQLILGGRNPSLRDRTTLGGLQGLVSAGHVAPQTGKELRQAYLYLRKIEHRIQMVNDEQTHIIPRQPEQVLRLARLAGYDDVAAFENDLTATLRTVHDHYAQLFEESEGLATTQGSLVFTGVDDHPDTIKTLSGMGFSDPSRIAAAFRKWHAGGIRATRSTRARELLTRLGPTILQSLSTTDDPQAAFQSFEIMLEQMPTGVQFFSLVLNNTAVLEQLIALATLSPRLARSMAVHAHLVESLISDSFLDDGPNSSVLAREEESLLFEEALNHLRRSIRERRFHISSHILLNGGQARDHGRQYSRLAEEAIQRALPIARREIIRAHGDIEGELAVIGMGRLGASALTATSDLDLIFIYDAPADAQSDHEKPLDAVTWFTRYVRRILTTLSAQTEEGGLYEVDMALRPSGRAGPAAVTLSAFRRYYENDAWTWEEMAMVKGRVVAGDAALSQTISDGINHILTRRRDPEKLRADVLEMRQRLLRDKPPTGPWDLKCASGGLTDIDFVVQYLALRHAEEFGRFPPHIADALPVFASRDLLRPEEAETLIKAWQAYEIVMQVKRAAMGVTSLNHEPLGPVIALVAERLNLPHRDEVLPCLAGLGEQVEALFAGIVGPLN